jgi:hypothetical protein
VNVCNISIAFRLQNLEFQKGGYLHDFTPSYPSILARSRFLLLLSGAKCQKIFFFFRPWLNRKQANIWHELLEKYFKLIFSVKRQKRFEKNLRILPTPISGDRAWEQRSVRICDLGGKRSDIRTTKLNKKFWQARRRLDKKCHFFAEGFSHFLIRRNDMGFLQTFEETNFFTLKWHQNGHLKFYQCFCTKLSPQTFFNVFSFYTKNGHQKYMHYIANYIFRLFFQKLY